jgi:hypothetical protein
MNETWRYLRPERSVETQNAYTSRFNQLVVPAKRSISRPDNQQPAEICLPFFGNASKPTPYQL